MTKESLRQAVKLDIKIATIHEEQKIIDELLEHDGSGYCITSLDHKSRSISLTSDEARTFLVVVKNRLMSDLKEINEEFDKL